MQIAWRGERTRTRRTSLPLLSPRLQSARDRAPCGGPSVPATFDLAGKWTPSSAWPSSSLQGEDLTRAGKQKFCNGCHVFVGFASCLFFVEASFRHGHALLNSVELTHALHIPFSRRRRRRAHPIFPLCICCTAVLSSAVVLRSFHPSRLPFFLLPRAPLRQPGFLEG